MLNFFARLWRWVKSWFVRDSPSPPPSPPPELSDLDYENTLSALLEEVARGGSWGQLQGVLLARNVDKERLARWLRRFGERWLAQPESHRELARRLVLLGERATGELGAVARRLGERLLVSSDRDSSLPSVRLESSEGEVTLTEVQKLNQLLAGNWGVVEERRVESPAVDESLRKSQESSHSVSESVPSNESESQGAQALIDRAIQQYQAGDYQGALVSFDRVLALQPDLYQAWYNRGVALSNLGRHEEALASYDQALALQPDFHKAWPDRGVALSNLGRYEEALASCDQAIALQPDYHLAWHNRGVALSNLGRHEEALASYDQALALQPDFHKAWPDRGVALSNLGRYEEALASCDQALLALQPDYHLAWNGRGLAAGRSSGYEPFLQQQFTASFRTEVSRAPQQLIPAFEAIDCNQHLEQFLTSLNASKALLIEKFAHLPNVTTQIQQPPPPELSQLIRQSSPQKLIEFIQQQRLSEEVVAQIDQTSCLHPSQFNPQLNQRGYPGAITSYQAELDKAIRRDTHPEGWGFLHHQTGLAHYYQGQQDTNPRSFWRKAETSYKTALQTLKPPEFEDLHLKVLQDLIRVLLDLRKTEEAAELQRRGADLVQRMLADPKRPERQKRQLALKSAAFTQLSVDLTLQSGNIFGALTLAETGKNTCLRWLLGYDELPNVNYSQIQHLLTPTTAAIYWHLSPSALTTFVIFPNATAPIVVENNTTEPNDQRPASLLQLIEWEKWLSDWNQRYQTYGSSKKKDTAQVEETDKKQHPWRSQMADSLNRLKTILNLSRITQHLQNHPIENLILIPHRDLHRFPLHCFFPNYTCTYLPSAYLGLQQQTQSPTFPLNSLLIVENPKSTLQLGNKAKPLPDLPFAEVEAALVRQLFSQVTAIENAAATHDYLQKTLQTPHQVFHFTGHGAYNSTNPAQSCLFLHGTDQLTLSEIVRLDFRRYYLICLAACETAVTGDQTITDEYVGLVSAFLKAGASYIISTLWTVESAASAFLMVQFYQQLQAGTPPAVALKAAQTWLKTATPQQLIEWLNAVIPKLEGQSAQIVLNTSRRKFLALDNSNPPYSHPYYWAAYTISGR